MVVKKVTMAMIATSTRTTLTSLSDYLNNNPLKTANFVVNMLTLSTLIVIALILTMEFVRKWRRRRLSRHHSCLCDNCQQDKALRPLLAAGARHL
jgi:hypothetical protein